MAKSDKYTDQDRMAMFVRHLKGALDDYGDLWTVKIIQSQPNKLTVVYNSSGNSITLSVKDNGVA